MRNTTILLLLFLGLTACKKEQTAVTPTLETPNTTTFTLTFENVMRNNAFFQTGPTEPIVSGESKSYSFVAGIGMRLSFAAMLVESNDLFYGFDAEGLALYDEEGQAITGDVTHAVRLWDAGTEVNETIGEGINQAPRQTVANSGEGEDGIIQLVDSLRDDLFYPVIDSLVQFSLTHNGDNEFTLTIENISQSEYMESALSAGVFAIHQKEEYLFKANEAASTNLEALVEDGDNTLLWHQLGGETGFSSIIGTGIYMTHQVSHPIFTNGEKDRGQGLEVLAEYGNPEALYNSLKNRNDLTDIGIFQDPVGNNVLNLGGKLVPGDRYVFSFEAKLGDYLSLANMLVETNDLFFAFAQTGLELFPGGEPINGDITSEITLWDAGTEANELPGAGAYQPLRNGAKESINEGGVVRPLDDEFSYPAINELVRVSIEVEE